MHVLTKGDSKNEAILDASMTYNRIVPTNLEIKGRQQGHTWSVQGNMGPGGSYIKETSGIVLKKTETCAWDYHTPSWESGNVQNE